MIENSILIIVSSFCMGRMIISYVDFRSCHKHFPNSLPLCQMNHAHNAHCHQMWLVGGATFTEIFTRIIAEVASSRVSRLQCCNQWQCWVGGLIVRCCLKHGAWSSQAPTPQ